MVKKNNEKREKEERNNEVKPPRIPTETKRDMEKFFYATSIPRILAEMAKNEEGSKDKMN